MPKGLHALPEIPYAPDEAAVTDMLALLPEAGPASFFAGIARVEPGHFVVIDGDGERARRHWQPVREMLRLGSSAAYAEALNEHFDRAVAARLRGAEGRIATHLSGGRDSGAVTATAAQLLAESGGSVTAFTSVPRAGYDEPVPHGRIADEGPLAAATAALHPNVEHVLIRSDRRALLEGLDRDFHLVERPILNLCNQHWFAAINEAAQKRGHRVLLAGSMGNMTVTYGGGEWLAELFGSGRWPRLIRESRALIRAGRATWRSAAVLSIAPWLPASVWEALCKAFASSNGPLSRYSAINPEERRRTDVDRRARAAGSSFPFRSGRNGWDSRMAVLRAVDPGNYYKGALGGWKVDIRDPTADRRLIEFCLAVPPEQYLRDGQTSALAARAFAGRLPTAVLEGRRRGLQAADRHEALTADRDNFRRELERFGEVPAAARVIDRARLAALVDNWPTGDWNSDEVSSAYRILLLRATAIGHFLRKASSTNA
jgi:asparagine synthase (glutamine-hydrolysing)